MIEVETLYRNPLGAHVSLTIDHTWVVSSKLQKIRDTAFAFLKTDLWKVLEEKEPLQQHKKR